MKNSLQLIDQLIEIAEQEQKELNHLYHSLHQSKKTVGDTSLVYHLKVLKQLVAEESNWVAPTTPVNLGGKEFQVALAFTRNPPLPVWADKLPKELNVGKTVRIKSGGWSGKVGIVVRHFINGDDCGNWGAESYDIVVSLENTTYSSVPVKDCEIIDIEFKEEFENCCGGGCGCH